MTFRIVVICHANVCRSVVGEATLSSALRDLDGIQVSSAGVAAHPGTPGCPMAAALVDAVIQETVTCHASVPLEQALGGASLVLTAERSQRGAVIRENPALRPATFTLPEAVDLAAAVVQESGSRGPHRPPDELVEEMDARRGLVAAVPRAAWEAPTRRFRRRRPPPEVHPWDLPDAHMQGAFAHEQVVPRVVDEAVAFAAALRAWTGRR